MKIRKMRLFRNADLKVRCAFAAGARLPVGRVSYQYQISFKVADEC